MSSDSQPSAPIGCGGVLLALATAVGVAFWVLMALTLLQPSSPRFPQQLGWDHYLLLSALWGIGIGLYGIVRAVRPMSGDPVVRLLWCGLCALLALTWPAQVMVLAAIRATRARTRQRLALLVLGMLALAGGCGWGSDVYGSQELDAAPSGVSTSALRGGWHNVTGRGVLELNADGRFTADDIPAEPGWGDSTTPRLHAIGTWTVTTDGAYPTVMLTVDQGASSPGLRAAVGLDIETFGSSLVLCRWHDDPDEECDSGFHR